MLKSLMGGLLLAAAASAHAASPWSPLAQADLDYVYQSIRANHPGAIDDQNAYFRDWMEKGYLQASADAAKAQSLDDVQALMRRYIAGFADGHLWVNYQYQKPVLSWAGVLVQRRGQRYRVALSEEPAVPVGAELASCGGRAIDTVINEDLLPSFFNNTQLDWVKTELADAVLTVQDYARHPEYAGCTFVVDGKARDVALKWRKLRKERYITLWGQLEVDLGKDSTITELRPGYYWVRLPQFQPNEAQATQIKQLTARMPSLRNAKLVIFDTRGNQGGDNEWGERVLKALYGEAYMQQQTHDEGYALWRASEGNLAYVRDDIVPKHKKLYGEGDPQVAYWSGLQHRLEDALAKGEPFARQEEAPAAAPAAKAAPVAPLSQARVALVTKSGCASSCLDFADSVLSIHGAVHLGETTGADTVYMDVRMQKLPSGLGGVVLAQKVYRGRPRAHNAAYVPHKPYGGDIYDTPALQAWAMQQLTAK